jgi:predicted phosphodiesterase
MKIAIVTDIHEDYRSLLRAETMISREGCDAIACLGDIVGFSVPFYQYFDTRNGAACVDWVKANCRWAVIGNHDLYAIRKLPESEVRGFKFPEYWYQMPYARRLELSEGRLWLYEDNELSARLGEEQQRYLMDLPEWLIIEEGDVRCMISHFIAPDLTGSSCEFLLNSNDLKYHYAWMQQQQCTLGFSGHIHANGLLRMVDGFPVLTSFGRSVQPNPYEWIGTPCISESKGVQGFTVWNTNDHSVKAISLRRRLLGRS